MSDLKQPKIYHTFKAKNKNSDDIVEYQIQDLPEQFHEQTLDLFMKDYVTDELFLKSKKLWENEGSLKAIRDIFSDALSHRLSIACFNNDGELVGVNLLRVITKSDPKVNYFSVNGIFFIGLHETI